MQRHLNLDIQDNEVWLSEETFVRGVLGVCDHAHAHILDVETAAGKMKLLQDLARVSPRKVSLGVDFLCPGRRAFRNDMGAG